MRRKKDKFYLYISITIAVILFGIIITSLISQIKSKGSKDIRARASASNALKMTGIISSINPDSQTVSIDNLRFVDEIKMLPGIWSVSLSSQSNIESLNPGTEVILSVDSKTLKFATKTLSAITLSKK